MRVIGVMSGSSLDGLDLVLCSFDRAGTGWRFSVEDTATVPYAPDLRKRLLDAMHGDAISLARLHHELGVLFGRACFDLMGRTTTKPDLIASHGHTIFHRPDEGLTTQIGCGAQIAAISGVATVCDFRTKDVALGGQGAPLVPLGERELFPGYAAFLNLGGIANVSIHRNEILGYDLAPCNQALNLLAEEAGKAYDEDGALARSGSIDRALLDRLNALAFYQQPSPRSLGREWFDEHLKPLITGASPLPDRMRTTVEHIAGVIAQQLQQTGVKRTLLTGGGAHNGFLVDRLRAMTTVQLEVPDHTIVDFKEAIIFAFLGLLRWRGEANTLRTVTGARVDSIGGAVYLPN